MCNFRRYVNYKYISHRLAIETERWVKPISRPICERVCFLCNLIEDEFHFILECNIHTDLRFFLIRKYYRERPNMFKLVQLLKSENKKEIAIYIEKAMYIRHTHVYN